MRYLLKFIFQKLLFTLTSQGEENSQIVNFSPLGNVYCEHSPCSHNHGLSDRSRKAGPAPTPQYLLSL